MISYYDLDIASKEIALYFKEKEYKWNYNGSSFLNAERKDACCSFFKDEIKKSYDYYFNEVKLWDFGKNKIETIKNSLEKYNFKIRDIFPITPIQDVKYIQEGVLVNFHLNQNGIIFICKYLGNERNLVSRLCFNGAEKSYNECNYIPTEQDIKNKFLELQKTPTLSSGRLYVKLEEDTKKFCYSVMTEKDEEFLKLMIENFLDKTIIRLVD